MITSSRHVSPFILQHVYCCLMNILCLFFNHNLAWIFYISLISRLGICVVSSNFVLIRCWLYVYKRRPCPSLYVVFITCLRPTHFAFLDSGIYWFTSYRLPSFNCHVPPISSSYTASLSILYRYFHSNCSYGFGDWLLPIRKYCTLFSAYSHRYSLCKSLLVSLFFIHTNG